MSARTSESLPWPWPSGAVRRRWKRQNVRILAMLAAGGFLFALGGSSLVHGLACALLPFVEKARMPAAAVVVNTLALSALAAIGWDALRFHRLHLGRFSKSFAALGGVILLFVALARASVRSTPAPMNACRGCLSAVLPLAHQARCAAATCFVPGHSRDCLPACC
ncbi:MAG: hypothetical protein QM757_33135 [Paludibaculum sp.]